MESIDIKGKIIITHEHTSDSIYNILHLAQSRNAVGVLIIDDNMEAESVWVAEILLNESIENLTIPFAVVTFDDGKKIIDSESNTIQIRVSRTPQIIISVNDAELDKKDQEYLQKLITNIQSLLESTKNITELEDAIEELTEKDSICIDDSCS